MIYRSPLIVEPVCLETASDARNRLELGADGVMMNTAIAGAKDPGNNGRGDELRHSSGGLHIGPANSTESSTLPLSTPRRQNLNQPRIARVRGLIV